MTTQESGFEGKGGENARRAAGFIGREEHERIMAGGHADILTPGTTIRDVIDRLSQLGEGNAAPDAKALAELALRMVETATELSKLLLQLAVDAAYPLTTHTVTTRPDFLAVPPGVVYTYHDGGRWLGSNGEGPTLGQYAQDENGVIWIWERLSSDRRGWLETEFGEPLEVVRDTAVPTGSLPLTAIDPPTRARRSTPTTDPADARERILLEQDVESAQRDPVCAVMARSPRDVRRMVLNDHAGELFDALKLAEQGYGARPRELLEQLVRCMSSIGAETRADERRYL